MAKAKGNKKKGQKKQRNQKILVALYIGVSAGIIWGLFSLLAYYLQFTDVGTSMYAKPILNPDYVLKWQGHFIGLAFFTIFSIIVSLIYAFLLVRFNSPWIGIAYGLVLWAIVFFPVNRLLDLTKSVKELGYNSNSIMLSIYILFGLFIGYSLSTEFNDSDREQGQSK